MVARHALLLARSGVLRWRLETFGLYMPSLPNARPWWRPNWRMLALLLQRRGPYTQWLREMDAMHAYGASGWWREQSASADQQLRIYIAQTNSAPDLDAQVPPVNQAGAFEA